MTCIAVILFWVVCIAIETQSTWRWYSEQQVHTSWDVYK